MIREIFIKEYKNNIMKGYDFVFIWNKNKKPKEAEYYKIKEDLKNIFKRNGILINENYSNKIN